MIHSEREEEILNFWKKNKIFEKSVNNRKVTNQYVFYDGPPFATGLPHHGHILASTIKDMVPRYFTMKGYRVQRRWGWDCHGLPIENLIEQDLDISGQKAIEEYGIGKFNQACHASIRKYDQEWEKVVKRIGRWIEPERQAQSDVERTFLASPRVNDVHVRWNDDGLPSPEPSDAVVDGATLTVTRVVGPPRCWLRRRSEAGRRPVGRGVEARGAEPGTGRRADRLGPGLSRLRLRRTARRRRMRRLRAGAGIGIAVPGSTT